MTCNYYHHVHIICVYYSIIFSCLQNRFHDVIHVVECKSNYWSDSDLIFICVHERFSILTAFSQRQLTDIPVIYTGFIVEDTCLTARSGHFEMAFLLNHQILKNHRQMITKSRRFRTLFKSCKSMWFRTWQGLLTSFQNLAGTRLLCLQTSWPLQSSATLDGSPLDSVYKLN